MINEVRYAGFSATPSDYECADGQLSASINLINEDGNLKTIFPPSVIQDNFGGADFSPLASFVHKSASFQGNHYIFALASGLISYAVGDVSGQPFSQTVPIATLPEGVEVRDINAMGNVLIVATSTGMFYFLWEKNAYTALGDHVPRLDMSFSLGGYLSKQSSELNFPSTIKTADFYEKLDSDDCWPTVQQAAKTAFSLLTGNASKKGWFTQPFFVRYALRMFDGSLVNISAPILQVPNSAAPRFGAQPITISDDKTSGVKVYCQSMVSALYYRLLNTASDIELLQKWSSLISAVEVYVSLPITIPDINNKELIASKRGVIYAPGNYVGAFSSDAIKDLPSIKNKVLLSSTAQWKLADIILFADRSSYYSSGPTHANLIPNCRSDKELSESLTTVAQFYKISEISFGSLVAALQRGGTKDPIIVPIASNSINLLNLATFPALTDYPTESADTFAPESLTAYNNRLSISNVRKFPAPPSEPMTMFPRIDAELSYDSDDGITSTPEENVYYYDVYVRIEENNKSIWRVASNSSARAPFVGPAEFSWGNFVYYPNANAKEIVVVCKRWSAAGQELHLWRFYLTPHELLAGAYAFLGLSAHREESNIDPDDFFEQLSVDLAEGYDYPNKIYTSEINNPFVFPDAGVNTMGSTGAKILATATAAKALSAGQFGQFPLYAFTDEGVWAMEVSSASGGFIARQPITRDVCISPEGVTQIDSSVLFPTDRGIMLISGSETICISDPINNRWPIRLASFPGLQTLFNKLFPGADLTEIVAFHDFLTAECRMVYDYVNQRIIVYNPHYAYAYVYSLKSKLWGMMIYRIRQSLNSYPEALVINDCGQLVNFSTLDTDVEVPSILLTRPLKLGLPDVLKTVDTVIQRGNFQRCHVQSVLYGSRDQDCWSPVWSGKDHTLRGFRGSPYKYFRIALLCNLSVDESLYGATLQFTPRQTNQPR
ncbi:MAG: hypothetical protein HDR99_05690 [Bacteroides sp.]|nr:hypothetical protein [Bacteroides sp.]